MRTIIESGGSCPKDGVARDGMMKGDATMERKP